MTALEIVSATNESRICAAIARDGACIVSDLLDAGACDALIKDFTPYLEALPWGVDELGYKSDFYGSKTKRLHGLFNKSPQMEQVLTNPVLVNVAKNLLLKNARDIRLSNTELMVLSQHQDVQEFHTDAGSWYHAQRQEQKLGQEILVSANIALTEFTKTNGATRVVPGSHLWAEDRKPEPEEICQALMPKGSALLYSGNVIHSGGANSDAVTRIGLYLGYVVSWLRPLENQLVTNDANDIHKLSSQAKQLLDVVEGGFTVIA